jgi:hypothetical protein
MALPDIYVLVARAKEIVRDADNVGYVGCLRLLQLRWVLTGVDSVMSLNDVYKTLEGEHELKKGALSKELTREQKARLKEVIESAMVRAPAAGSRHLSELHVFFAAFAGFSRKKKKKKKRLSVSRPDPMRFRKWTMMMAKARRQRASLETRSPRPRGRSRSLL